jgi:hypothetical protein
MAEKVRYIVQALRDGQWVTIRNCTSYRKAVAVAKKSENRRLMVQTLQKDVDAWLDQGDQLTLQEWQAQSDAERDAVEMKRRQQ